jgi:hypothetical protein
MLLPPGMGNVRSLRYGGIGYEGGNGTAKPAWDLWCDRIKKPYWISPLSTSLTKESTTRGSK